MRMVIGSVASMLWVIMVPYLIWDRKSVTLNMMQYGTFPGGGGGGGVLYCKPRNFKAHFLSLALRQAIKLAKVKANMIIILCLGNLIDSLITALSDSQLILLYFLGYKTGVFPKNLDLSQKTDLETFGIVLEGKNLYYSKIS